MVTDPPFLPLVCPLVNRLSLDGDQMPNVKIGKIDRLGGVGSLSRLGRIGGLGELSRLGGLGSLGNLDRIGNIGSPEEIGK